MFNKDILGRMKKRSWLVNVSRGAICDRDSIAQALEDGQLAGYAGEAKWPAPLCIFVLKAAMQDAPSSLQIQKKGPE